jgi:TrmH family RNA methyltransferase
MSDCATEVEMGREMENLRVVLVGTRNPLNLGAVARAMSNFGAMHLRVVQPYEKAYRSAVSAVGASAVLQNAEEFATAADAVGDCWMVVGTTAVGNREIQHPLRSLEVAGALLRRGMTKGKVALLFGSEKWGLSNESLSHCHWLVRIPTREEHRSMNLGQAAAGCLYEIARGMRVAVAKKKEGKSAAARMETVERIGEALLPVLVRSGYTGARKRELAEEKLRRMLRRIAMTEADAEVLLGMVRKIGWWMEES